MEIENFDKTRGKFLVEIKREIFRFNSLSNFGPCNDVSFLIEYKILFLPL